MKKAIFLFSAIALLSACNNTTKPEKGKMADKQETSQSQSEKEQPKVNYYGDTISEKGAIASAQLSERMKGKDSLNIKVRGTINESCSKKGCWMKMDMGNDEEMRISFVDYSFFVPKDLNGEEAIVEGYAKRDTISVKHLKHFAKDAGKSEKEIARITEPEVRTTYTAHGVIIKDKG